MDRSFRNVVRLAVVGGVFAAGFLCGSVTQRSADAQMGGALGDAVMKQAGEAAGAGGALGTAAQLGSSIVEMQQHVDGLQKNIDALNKIKAGLGG